MEVSERFLTYVGFPTMSDEESDTVPSTVKQRALGEHLVAELRAIGLTDARLDVYGYVYATLEENREGMAHIALLAHMDTSPDMPDAPIRVRTLTYGGGDIPLSEDGTLAIREAECPSLSCYRGHRLAVTDGRTLLGGDDKAGIAEIVTAVERLLREGRPHGRITVCFTPDEEIGRGTEHIDLAALSADYAYTVDGGRLGELEYENFNAARATVSVRGFSIHPGSAKGRMKNAARILTELAPLLPASELPELTEGYEGFHHLVSLRGDVTEAEAVYLIRDHDREKFEDKKANFRRAVATLNERYGEGTVTLTVSDSYYNMKEVVARAPHTVERARAAMRGLGITPIERPIRGGTDGALLSYRGLPCPNLGTGTENMHSGTEFVSLDDMERAVSLLVRLCEEATQVTNS